MKNISVEQIFPVIADDPLTAVQEVNKAMRELSGQSPRLEMIDKTTFYIYYKSSETIAESYVDEQILRQGYEYRCGDCPHLTRRKTRNGDVDHRCKVAYCELHKKQVFLTSYACEERYREECQ